MERDKYRSGSIEVIDFSFKTRNKGIQVKNSDNFF